MKTAKPLPSDLSSNRRAQPLRQTRNNPPRSSVAGSRQFGSRGSLGGLDGPSSPEQAIEIFPAITHFADAITALPKELVRHFTLLKEVDAKIFAPEDVLGGLVDAALNAPPPERKQLVETQHTLGPTSVPMSAQGSVNGSMTNGHVGSVASIPDPVEVYNPAQVWDPANRPRRELFQHLSFTMQNMLVSLDEKNHVISTAAEALNKQLARIDDCFPHIEDEISEEARYGSLTHWAYPENRTHKSGSGGNSRRDLASGNNLSATQHLADEAAARSDARKQALLAKKSHKNHAESDFDEHHDSRHKEKKVHGNSKVRKTADASAGVGLGITNGVGTNGNPPKRRKVEKGPSGGAVMERALSGVFGSNGTTAKKAASPRETPPGDGPKKRQRGANTTNGQTRKRNNTVTSMAAMSPSLASSPIRSTFADAKLAGRETPPVTNGGRPGAAKGRQNSVQSIVENGIQRPSPAPTKQNGSGVATPDLGAAANVTGRSIAEIKTLMKETATNSKGEHLLEDVDQEGPGLIGGLVVGSRKDALKREHENSAEPMQAIQTTTITTTTKSGRQSKPSTPAIPQFPEPRARPTRNALETASTNKRSHKKGAGAAAQQQLIAQLGREEEEASSAQGDDEDEEINPDEQTYCYCNNVSYGAMVGCDNNQCKIEWFHLECVGLKTAPNSKTKWYCDDCKKAMSGKRFQGR